MSEDVEQLIEGAAAVREGSADGTAAWFSAASLGPLLKRQVAPVVSFTIGRKGSGVSSLNHLVDIEFGVPPDGAHGMKSIMRLGERPKSAPRAVMDNVSYGA